MVEATLTYLADMDEKPVYYFYEPPPGVSWRNTRGDRHMMSIGDARDLTPPPSLDREGFTLVHHETAVADLFDGDAVRAVYYREVEQLVKDATGAEMVLAFDHNVRSSLPGVRRERRAQEPVRFAHNDYTEGSGPQRVRDLLPERAETLVRNRFAVINVWKPIREPVRQMPLAVCDARSIRPRDLVPTDLRYRERTGEVYSLAFNPEAMLLKCFDSDAERARFTAHTAFEDPTSPADAPPRESIEVRTLAFFA
jgi:hypothetical protein